jgi:hypothetical protein
MHKPKWMIAIVVSLMLLVSIAVSQAPETFEMTETETLKLQAKQKDITIYQQQLQLLQQQYSNIQAQMQQTTREYQETVEAVRKAHKWENAQFNYQTGKFEAIPKEPAKTAAPAKK